MFLPGIIVLALVTLWFIIAANQVLELSLEDNAQLIEVTQVRNERHLHIVKGGHQ